jgi:adenylate cyclase
VRYVLEGSVRREGDRVRVTVQLLDAIDGNYIWSERYDRQIKDILALQTEIMMQISIELQIILTDGEQARLSTTEMISNVEFYETQLKLQGYYQQGTIEGRETAKQLARKLIDMNPQNSLGYFWLGYLHLYDNFYGTTRNPQESIRIAEEKAEQALTLDKDTKDLNLLLGYIHLQKGEHEAAVSRMEKAVEEQPNGYEPHQHLGIMLFFVGRYSEAIQHLEMAHRLDPYPDADLTAWLGIVHTTPGPDALHNVKKAKELGEKGLKVNPNNFFPHLLLTLLYSYENNMDRAGFHSDEMLRISPAYSLDVFRRIWVFRDQKIFNFHIDLLRKAGIPEK